VLHAACKLWLAMLVAFDSNVLTAFLTANAKPMPSAGDDLAAFQLFMYAPKLVILPTITQEADRILHGDRRKEHLTWVWYHFDEALLDREAEQIESRTRELLPYHSDADDCRIVAEAEVAGVDVLTTIDKRISKRLQSRTRVRLLPPPIAVAELAIARGAHPRREPASGHPHAGAAWWRI